MSIAVVRCLKDNFSYLVIDDEAKTAAVVDPGESAPVARELAARGLSLRAVWCTHHHADHVGGIAALLDQWPACEVVCHRSDQERIVGATQLVDDGDVVSLGAIEAEILYNPGHTRGAISYFIATQQALFTGDTLFGAGCGRLFEGDAAMMHHSLRRLAAMPPSTKVYFGHEYTVANLRFAAAVEPSNEAIRVRAEATAELVGRGQESTPSLLSEELATNPFLRCSVGEVAQSAARHGVALDDVAVFALLRTWKNNFA